MMVSLLQP